MIDTAEQMAMQTKLIARRDVVELADVELTDEEDARWSSSSATRALSIGSQIVGRPSVSWPS
jgi:hypothetical protein